MRVWINFGQRFHQLRHAFAPCHDDAFPFPTIAFARLMALRAQANSVARIASPIGMTMNAGPGKTINATPIKRTVPPIIATMSFRSDVSRIFTRANLSREGGQPLLKLRRRVGDDQREFAFVAQLQDMADAVDLGD